MKLSKLKFVFLFLLAGICLSYFNCQVEKPTPAPESLVVESAPVSVLAKASDFQKGVNAPWHNGFWDFGEHYLWGHGYDSSWWENFFSDLENYNANIARIWVFADGRCSPDFDENNVNLVTGFDQYFYDDMDDLLSRANNHNVMVILCLWSFDAMEDFTSDAGIYAGNHKDMFTNSQYIQAFLDNALAPMVERYAANSAIYSWEIINEPEWAMSISGAGTTTQTLTEEEMQNFVGKCAACIHNHGGSGVSVGSASWKWYSDIELKNFWSDSELQAASGESEAYLDIVQVHYYNWMHPWFDPYDYNLDYFYTGSKPVIIGECPAAGDEYHTPEEMINATYNNGYAGIVYWSYVGGDNVGNWDDCKDEIYNFSGGTTTTTTSGTTTTTTAGTSTTTTTAATTTTTTTGGGCTCDAGCASRTVKTLPFTQNGVGEYCWETSGTFNYVNSWNLQVLEINGVDYTNKWSNSFPAKINGVYYIYYKSTLGWGHFEATGSGGTTTTTTAGTSTTTTTAATTTTTTAATTTTTAVTTTTTTVAAGCTCDAGCESRTSISPPFTKEGAGEYCWETTSLGNYINSWGLEKLEINGVDYTNIWSGSFPAKINGVYYVYYKGSQAWSHFETN